MTRSLIISGIVLLLASSAVAGLLSEGGGGPSSAQPGIEEPAATATPEASPTPEPVPNRADCNQIRGTDYHSPEERQWFLANCVTSR